MNFSKNMVVFFEDFPFDKAGYLNNNLPLIGLIEWRSEKDVRICFPKTLSAKEGYFRFVISLKDLEELKPKILHKDTEFLGKIIKNISIVSHQKAESFQSVNGIKIFEEPISFISNFLDEISIEYYKVN